MENLAQILNVPLESRNETWEQQFLEALPKSVILLDNPTPTQEFDGWPYLHARTTEGPGEPVQKILQWLSERGIGLILNSQKSVPDYVFTYGMIWSHRARGSFLGTLEPKSSGKHQIDFSKYKSFGEPSEQILPKYARQIVRQFLLDQNIIAPKILVASEDDRNFDFCFSIESLGYPPEKEFAGILEALSWFFPPDYSLALVREGEAGQFWLL